MLSMHSRFILKPVVLLGIAILYAQGSMAQCNNGNEDFAFLKDLYESTNGDNWTNNTGWDKILNNEEPADSDDENCDLSGMFGVTLNANGDVSVISLPNNNLIGTHPTEEFPDELTLIDLSNNSIKGAIPDHFDDSDLLTTINYANNEFTGDVPTDYSDEIEHLDFSGNGLSGPISMEITEYTLLQTLHLGDNDNFGSLGIEGKIPEELSYLTNLTSLSLHDNNLSGCYPAQLKSLCSAGSSATISNGNNLEDWDTFCASDKGICICNDNDFALLKSLSESTNVASWKDNTGWQPIIDNNVCPLNYNISDAFGITVDENFRVDSISLRDNDLKGELPTHGWSDLKHTTSINLSRNLLEGTLPFQLGRIPQLKDLRLHQNRRSGSAGLSGSIVINTTNFDKIEVLSLNQNALTGGIDSDLGSKVNLRELWLGDNQLGGSIPHSIGDLKNLTTLRIEQNGMSGCYPPNLINLCGQLTNFNINGGNNNFDDAYSNFCIAPTYSGVCVDCTETDVEWAGGVDNQWSTPLNWEYGCVPTKDTDVTISKGEIMISSDAQAKDLDISSEFVHLTISTGNKFTLGCNPCNDETFINHGSILNDGTIQIDSSEEDALSNFNSLINNGLIVIDTSESAGLVNEGMISNTGDIQVSHIEKIGIENEGTINNSGNIDLNSIWGFDAIDNEQSIVNNLSAEIKLSEIDGDGIENDGDITNDGLIAFNVVDNGISNSGSFNNKKLLEITDSRFNGFRNNSDGSFINSGVTTINITGSRGISNNGTISNEGQLDISNSNNTGISSSSVFHNQGSIIITNSNNRGLWLRTDSSFFNLANSTFTIGTTTETPLEIEVGGILEGYPTIEIID